MTTLSDFKQVMAVGQTVEITNHYITREDHPCFGTRQASVTKANSASYGLDGSRWGTPWPKASQVERVGDAWKVFGGGAGQKADDLFLTVRVVSA